MYVTETSLPHLLRPQDYHAIEVFHRERELLRNSWHVVGTTAELGRDGDFITTEVCDVPLQVRNFDGQLKALSNVCAHRHCLINSLPKGNSASMRCQYHGWEYRADGRTGRIPEPKNFIPFDRERLCLPSYHVEQIGQLVLINLSSAPTPIREVLGNDFHAFLAERFGDQWRLALRWQPDYAANWKVPIENSLEAYHVPAVHPKTFKVDPGEQKSEHLLLKNRTAFMAMLPFAAHSRVDELFQSLEGRVVRSLGYKDTRQYSQHHVFPNLLFSFTDAISLCQCILPTGPTTCRSVVRQFSRMPMNRPTLTPLARIWGGLTSSLNKHILKEDRQLFGSIQKGLEHSPHSGILGRCEERLHAFQCFMQTQLRSQSVAASLESEIPRP